MSESGKSHQLNYNTADMPAQTEYLAKAEGIFYDRLYELTKKDEYRKCEELLDVMERLSLI